MNQFYKSPFVFITTLLIIGVISSEMIAIWYWLIVYLIFVASLVRAKIEGVIKTGDLKGGLILSIIPLLGALLFYSTTVADEGIELRDSSFILTVEEMDASDKVWKKGVGQINFIVDSSELRATSERILFYSRNELAEGDLIMTRGDVLPIENNDNPGEFDAKGYWRSKQIRSMTFIGRENYLVLEKGDPGLIRSFFKGLRLHFSTLLDRHVPEKVLGIAKAILLGDKSNLSLETRNSFANAGAMHVLAVSGLHVGIIMYLLMYVLQRFSRVLTKRNALIVVLVITWLYAGVTNFSPSVVRASLMFSILLGSQFMSKQHNSLNALFFSAFLLIVIDPLIIWDIGFQLSYLAMLGILLLYKKISKFIYLENLILQRIWEGTSVGIAAQVFTTPLSLYYFHQFPNYFMISNLGVMVLAGVILGLGLILFAVGSIHMLGKAIGLLLGFTLFAMLYFIQFVESIPGSVATGFDTSSYLLLTIYTCLLAIILIKSFRERWYLWGPVIAVLVVLIQLDRYQNMTSDEFVLFNSNKLVVSVKKGDEILCFYEDNDKALRQAERLMGDYQKVRPGSVSFIPLGEGDYSLSKIQTSFKYTKDFLECLLVDQTLLLHRTYSSKKKKGIQNIYMPYLSIGSDEESLKQGALILTLD